MVTGCDVLPSHPTHCLVQTHHNQRALNLTCSVRNVKPAVTVQWIREFESDDLEPLVFTSTVQRVVLPVNSQRNGNFAFFMTKLIDLGIACQV